MIKEALLKNAIVFLIFFSLLGCGTIRTLNPPQNKVTIKYGKNLSYCKEISRIYSGISYDFCMFHGEPNVRGKGENALIVILDIPFSLLADTLALPYTIFAQKQKGKINVN